MEADLNLPTTSHQIRQLKVTCNGCTIEDYFGNIISAPITVDCFGSAPENLDFWGVLCDGNDILPSSDITIKKIVPTTNGGGVLK